MGSYKPNEFAVDVAYSRKLGDEFSGGIALRYIHSSLTGGITVGGNATKAGNSVAADVSFFYKTNLEISGKDAEFGAGLAITNIGSKMSYTDKGTKDFIPINLRLGPSLKIKLNDYNELAFLVDFNKLLVPTPPVYSDSTIAGEENPIIFAGKDPNVGVAQGIFQSLVMLREEEKKSYAKLILPEVWNIGMISNLHFVQDISTKTKPKATESILL